MVYGPTQPGQWRPTCACACVQKRRTRYGAIKKRNLPCVNTRELLVRAYTVRHVQHSVLLFFHAVGGRGHHHVLEGEDAHAPWQARQRRRAPCRRPPSHPVSRAHWERGGDGGGARVVQGPHFDPALDILGSCMDIPPPRPHPPNHHITTVHSLWKMGSRWGHAIGHPPTRRGVARLLSGGGSSRGPQSKAALVLPHRHTPSVRGQGNGGLRCWAPRISTAGRWSSSKRPPRLAAATVQCTVSHDWGPGTYISKRENSEERPTRERCGQGVPKPPTRP